jgi:hypothetical protein
MKRTHHWEGTEKNIDEWKEKKYFDKMDWSNVGTY